MFNEKISQSLCKIIREYGSNVCREPSRLEGLLKDYCGEYKKEIFIIVSTAKEGVPRDICDTCIPIEILKPRLVSKIEDNLWFTNEISENVVDLWLLAFGKLASEKYVEDINKSMDTKKIYRTIISNNFTKNNIVDTVKPIEYKVKIGEYVQFGKYYNKPILWRVINIDSDGSPMIYSVRILCLKPFDAVESGEDGQRCVCNKCENSNLREWLNSSDKVVKYTTQPSTNQAGFLSDFSELERAEIKEVTRKSIVAEIDKVYLLDVKELHDYVFSNSKIGNYIKVPTKEAVANGEYKDSYINDKKIWGYWFKTTTTPSATYYPNTVRGGVFPALNLKSGVFKFGKGTMAEPYVK